MKSHNTQIQHPTPIHIPPPNPPPPQQQQADPAAAATAATQHQQVRWEGKGTAELSSNKAEQVWLLWADFCGVHKWFPNLAASYLVEGEPNEVGSLRYCVGKGEEPMWGKERLLEMDHERRVMRYEVVENNVGLKGYVATIRVSDAEGEGGGGCKVEWSFVAEAVEGWGEEGLQRYIQSSLDSIVKKMEESLMITN
uniref:Lachrymatory-factor synthase n=1 Tax=Kalanchoe fedtschenkoi TaxID=63787 RepID=A0A7N0T5N7_KALFE